MRDEIAVSVICLVYNHEKYLRKCLDGFVMQKTNFKFEVIVHDDASTDNSAEIIREYEKKYPDIIKPIYQTENQFSKGIGITQTFINDKIKGNYTASCEGDDFWCDEYKLQKQYDFMESHPECSMCTCNVRWVEADTLKPIGLIPIMQVDRINDFEQFLKLLEIWDSPFQTSSFFMKNKCRVEFHENGPEFLKKCTVGDVRILIWFALNGKIGFLPDIMSNYRHSSQNSWTEKMQRNIEKRLKFDMSIYDVFKNLDSYTDKKYIEAIKKILHRKQIEIFILGISTSSRKRDIVEYINDLTIMEKIKIRLILFINKFFQKRGA